MPKLDVDNKYVVFGGAKARIIPASKELERLLDKFEVLAEAPLGADLTYRFRTNTLVGRERALLGSAAPTESLDLWHRRLGHRNMRDLGHAIRKNLLSGVSPKAAVNSKHGVCDACAKSKCTRHSLYRAVPAQLKEEARRLTPQIRLFAE